MSATIRRPRAIPGFDTQKNTDLIGGTKRVHSHMSGATSLFGSPPITMVAFLALITGLDTAQSGVKGGPKGSATARDTKAKALISALETLIAYVQSLADAAEVSQAISIIEAAGLQVAAVASPTKEILSLANAKPSGSVKAKANASVLTQAAAGGKPTSKNRSFNWESTVDGGKTFVRQDSTPSAETILTGFTPGTQVGVRVSVTLSKQPMGDWSQVVYIQAQ